MSKKEEFIFVPLSQPDFNWDKVIVAEPVKNSFKGKDGKMIEWTTSKITYHNGAGIYMELAPQKVWGIQGTYPMNGAEKNALSIDGYQICYPMTSETTVDNPTTDEKVVKSRFDGATKIATVACKKFCSIKPCPLPKSATVSYNSESNEARENGTEFNWNNVIKPLYEIAKVKKEGSLKAVEDPTKPRISYIKFCTAGSGEKLVCHTKLKGNKGVPFLPTKYLYDKENNPNTQGIAHPVVKLEEIYWGAHGDTGRGGSIKFLMHELNYKPVSRTVVIEKSFLAPIEDDGTESEHNSSSDSEDTKELKLKHKSFIAPQGQINTSQFGTGKPEEKEKSNTSTEAPEKSLLVPKAALQDNVNKTESNTTNNETNTPKSTKTNTTSTTKKGTTTKK